MIVKTRVQLAPINSNVDLSMECDVVVGKRLERPKSATVGKRRTSNTPMPPSDAEESPVTSQFHSPDGDSETSDSWTVTSSGRENILSSRRKSVAFQSSPSPDREETGNNNNISLRLTGRSTALLSVPSVSPKVMTISSTTEGLAINKRKIGRSSPLQSRQHQSMDGNSPAMKTRAAATSYANRPTSPVAGYVTNTSWRVSPADDDLDSNQPLPPATADVSSRSRSRSRGSSRDRSPPSAPCNSPQPPVMMLPLYDELSLPVPIPDALPSGSGLLVACDLYLASGRKVADKYRARSLLDVSPTTTAAPPPAGPRDFGITPTSLRELYNAPLVLESPQLASFVPDRKPGRRLQPIERNV